MNWLHVWQWILDFGWLVILLLLFKHFLQKKQTLMQAQSWLKAKGHINECEWVKIGHSVWPKIEYTYQVCDKEMIGEDLFLDKAYNNPNSKHSRLIAYKTVVAFKENMEIEVFYNPNHPEQSTLDVTIPLKLNVILFLIGILIFIHLGLIVWRYLG